MESLMSQSCIIVLKIARWLLGSVIPSYLSKQESLNFEGRFLPKFSLSRERHRPNHSIIPALFSSFEQHTHASNPHPLELHSMILHLQSQTSTWIKYEVPPFESLAFQRKLLPSFWGHERGLLLSHIMLKSYLQPFDILYHLLIIQVVKVYFSYHRKSILSISQYERDNGSHFGSEFGYCS